jgi:hypothetical protein
VHGWACPRLALHIVAPAAPWPPGSLDLPSPTPTHESAGAGAAPSRAEREPRLHAPVTTAGDVLGNGSAAAAPPPPHGFRFAEPHAVLEASRAGRRPGERSPASFLPNGHSNGVAPGTLLPGGSSSEEEDGGAPGSSASLR